MQTTLKITSIKKMPAESPDHLEVSFDINEVGATPDGNPSSILLASDVAFFPLDTTKDVLTEELRNTLRTFNEERAEAEEEVSVADQTIAAMDQVEITDEVSTDQATEPTTEEIATSEEVPQDPAQTTDSPTTEAVADTATE